MKIAIIEKGHFEVAYTLLNLFDNGHNQIFIYLEAESHKQLKLVLSDRAEKFTWVVQDKTEPNRKFISRMFNDIRSKEFDLLYFDTIADNFIVYAQELTKMKELRNILTIHDINGFFSYKLAFSLRKVVRSLGKKDLLKHINAFNVISETMKASLSAKLPTPATIWNIPGSFFDPASYTVTTWHPGQTFHICIPGSIDYRRRDYFQAFELLKLARQQELDVHITLLGSFKEGFSETIRNQCRLYQGANANLGTYDESVVDQLEFDSMLNSCHFIWSPLQAKSLMDEGVVEQYGVSTCSGNLADVIRTAKPCLVPPFLIADKALHPILLRYSSTEGIIKFLKELNEVSYLELMDRAKAACLNYTIDEIRTRNAPLFD